MAEAPKTVNDLRKRPKARYTPYAMRQRLYADRKWRKAAEDFRRGRLCVHCEAKGESRLAQCVDHIKPHKGNLELFWDVENWQPLCNVCHNRKSANE